MRDYFSAFQNLLRPLTFICYCIGQNPFQFQLLLSDWPGQLSSKYLLVFCASRVLRFLSHGQCYQPHLNGNWWCVLICLHFVVQVTQFYGKWAIGFYLVAVSGFVWGLREIQNYTATTAPSSQNVVLVYLDCLLHLFNAQYASLIWMNDIGMFSTLLILKEK